MSTLSDLVAVTLDNVHNRGRPERSEAEHGDGWADLQAQLTFAGYLEHATVYRDGRFAIVCSVGPGLGYVGAEALDTAASMVGITGGYITTRDGSARLEWGLTAEQIAVRVAAAQ